MSRRIDRIERIADPGREVFEREFSRPGRPVILTGILDSWKARGTWTAEALAARIGYRPVGVFSSAGPRFAISPEEGPRFRREVMTFAAFRERAAEPATGRTYYIQAASIPTELPELAGDIEIPNYFDPERLTAARLWLGLGDQTVALHYDDTPNLLALVRGQKRIVLYDPDQLPFLYPSPLDNPHPVPPYSQVDIERPDLARFPEFARAESVEVALAPGEVLFIPAFWWHQVTSFGENIAVNFWWRLVAQQAITEAGKAFLRFRAAYQALPPELRGHLARLANYYVFRDAK